MPCPRCGMPEPDDMNYWEEEGKAMIRDSNGAQVDLPEGPLDDTNYPGDSPDDEEGYPGDPSLDEMFPREELGEK